MTRLIYADRNALRRWHTRRLWKEWAPFIIVAMMAAGLLLVLGHTAPIFRPLPVPGATTPTDSLFKRFAELVGLAHDSTGASYESAELKLSPRDSN